jgi:hypothetical protein
MRMTDACGPVAPSGIRGAGLLLSAGKPHCIQVTAAPIRIDAPARYRSAKSFRWSRFMVEDGMVYPGRLVNGG